MVAVLANVTFRGKSPPPVNFWKEDQLGGCPTSPAIHRTALQDDVQSSFFFPFLTTLLPIIYRFN